MVARYSCFVACKATESSSFSIFSVPVEMEGGLLFELLGYSVSDPSSKVDDTPIVLRSYHTQQFLLTVLHLKGSSSKINVKGINEVQDLLSTGRIAIPKSVHEVIARLAYHLSRWDDRLFRKFIFGAANEIEFRLLNWKTYEDPHLINVIFNQDIKKLATKVFRVQWSLHARKEIVVCLRHLLRGSAVKSLLEEIQDTTNEMLQEQEVVRGRLFTIQDVLKSTVRACLEDKTRRITHNGGIIGICGLVVSVIVSIFGMNLDGIPRAKNSPYAFASFCVYILFIGMLLTYFSMLHFGLKKPDTEEQVNARKPEIQELFSIFKRDVETHGKAREGVFRIRTC
ncbi:uncharacterized protein LOC110020894 isoform X2 [Phalaenopsis equestris]|uniref:uncharacterized protein LOC110020894 isoform X2 n=1 Tax=Phalaenopsis equestris TaxID=78828 RepID=UPI0009E1D12B|nr:uncharacterized protein LOC110020894 isoform X2 [Phalaenopsis equestris]